MTTIVAVEDASGTVMVADAVTTAGDRVYSSPHMNKIVRRDLYLIAAAGTALPCDLVQYCWIPPLWDGVTDIPNFARSMIVPSLRRFLSNNEWTPDASADDVLHLLVSVAGYTIQIAEDFSVLHRTDGLYAIGTGSAYAIGALEAGASPTEAVEIAARNDVNSGIPVFQMEQRKRSADD